MFVFVAKNKVNKFEQVVGHPIPQAHHSKHVPIRARQRKQADRVGRGPACRRAFMQLETNEGIEICPAYESFFSMKLALGICKSLCCTYNRGRLCPLHSPFVCFLASERSGQHKPPAVRNALYIIYTSYYWYTRYVRY